MHCANFLALTSLPTLPGRLGTHYRQLNTLQTSPGFCTSLPTTILTGKESAYTDAQAETYTDDEKELLSIYKALPTEKRYEFKGEMKGYLKALEESRKYLDGEKRLSV